MEGKIFVDAVVVPDQLFWALNLNFAPGVQKASAVDAKWARGSGANISSALSYAITPHLF